MGRALRRIPSRSAVSGWYFFDIHRKERRGNPCVSGWSYRNRRCTLFHLLYVLFDKTIARSKLSGAAYNENNSRVFAPLSEALKNSINSTTLRPFARRRDEREAFNALVKQNLGSSKWEEEIEKAETVVMSCQWNGRSSRIPLDTDIHYLCTSLRKPGGTIQDPGNANTTIFNPGSSVRHTTEIRLNITCRAAKYFVNIGRTPMAVNLAWTFVKQFRLLDNIIEKHQPPQDL